MKKSIIIASLAVVLLGGSGGGYLLKHNADVAHAQKVKHAQVVERNYQSRLADYKRNLASWNTKNDNYNDTKSAMEPVFSATDEVSGMVTTGGYDYDELTAAVQDVSSSLNTASRSLSVTDNYELLRNVERAAGNWTKGANIWLTWKNDDTDTRELEDLPLEQPFKKADTNVYNAQSALDDMKPDAPQPTKPQRPAVPKA